MRRLLAGQALAHHKRDRILQRRVGPVRDVLVLAFPVIAVFQHGREVAGDARHPPRPDRLDPRLFDGVEHRAGRPGFGREPAVDGRVVTGEAQGHRVGVPADHRDIVRVELARRLGQTRLAAHERRPVGGERHLKVAVLRDRAHAGGDGALQRLSRRALLVSGLAVGGGHKGETLGLILSGRRRVIH